MRGIQTRFKTQQWHESPQLQPTRTLEDLPGIVADGVPLDEFGGDARQAHESSGYFKAIRTGGRWWLITPAGHRFIHIAVNSVSPGRMRNGQPALPPQMKAAFAQRFGNDPRKWRDQTLQLLRELGFNGTGSWSLDAVNRQARPPLTYCPNHSFMGAYGEKRGGTWQEPGHKAYPNGCIFAFDPDFEPFCEQHAKQLAASADDPYLLGHFTDNEMPFPVDLLDRYLKLGADDPGHREAVRWLTEQIGLPDPGRITDQLREIWRGHVADTYLRKVCGAMRKVDANHMILGPRFHGPEKGSEAVFAAAGRHLDVVAVNHYKCWTPGRDVARWTDWSGRPTMITEWYAKGDDVGLANTTGAGWTVHTQEERGWFYQNFALGLLETRTCVGWHWFKYIDNDPTDPDAEPSNIDSNKGIVNVRYEPYGPLVEKMRELNRRVYAVVEQFDSASRHA